ncbi:MAG: SIS domain-containing protein [Acidobacteria bacterium]|nr:SIS domain-containing protein [Acidobacteriota bacterium]
MSTPEINPEPKPGTSNSAGYFAGLGRLLERLPYGAIDQVAEVLLASYYEGRTLFVFGNGGSAALASHFATDLGKGTAVNGKPRFRVVALTDNVALISAWANDARYDDIFSEQLRNLVQAGDTAFAISASGNSPNVLNALTVAREAGARTIGITGFEGGRMRELCDLCVVVPSDHMQFIEDAHLGIAHAVFTALRHRMQAAAGTRP